jgi:glycerol-3-phosphate dehydrogenase
MDMLEEIRRDPKQGEVLITGTEYLRCELHHAARHEMVTRLEDFLRRRSKISLVVPEDTIRNSPGLMEACEILFGDKARERLDEYLAEEADPLREALTADAETDNPAHSEKLRW